MPINATERERAREMLTAGPVRAADHLAVIDQSIEQVRRDQDISEQLRATRLEKLRGDRQQHLDSYRAEVGQAAETLRSAAAELEAPPADAASALLAETREQRAWARAQRQLDAGMSWPAIVTAAENAGDAAALRALRQELPVHLDPRGSRDVATAVGRVVDLATARSLGDDGGAGTAARARLHAEAHLPAAEAALTALSAGRGDLGSAMRARAAEKEAQSIAAAMDAPVGSGAGSEDSGAVLAAGASGGAPGTADA